MSYNFDMGWVQAGSVIISVLISLITAVYIFYKLTKSEISVIRESISLMNIHHREDIKTIADKMNRMDEKWEKLFERLYFKDNPKKKM